MSTVPVGVAAAPVGDTTASTASSPPSAGTVLNITVNVAAPSFAPAAAPAAAPATKQCSKRKGSWQCSNWFPADDPRKTCSHHRKQASDFMKSSKGKVINKRSKSKHKKEIAKSDAKYKSKNKKQIAKSDAAYDRTPAGRASQKKDSARLIRHLYQSMRKMVRGTPNAGATPLSRGLFVSEADAQAHFRSTFAPWMTSENRGAHRRGAPYKTKWEIGHQMPKAIFNPLLIADVEKCFSRRNLIAQDARENRELGDSLALSDAQLLVLQPLWPAAAGGELAKLKSLFARVAKARAEADDGEEDEEASSDGEEEDEDEEDEEASSDGEEEDEDEEDEDESSDDDEM